MKTIESLPKDASVKLMTIVGEYAMYVSMVDNKYKIIDRSGKFHSNYDSIIDCVMALNDLNKGLGHGV